MLGLGVWIGLIHMVLLWSRGFRTYRPSIDISLLWSEKLRWSRGFRTYRALGLWFLGDVAPLAFPSYRTEVGARCPSYKLC